MDDLVSVIMPTYKRSLEFVQRAVESLINQTYTNLEIIVIDDSPLNYSEIKRISEFLKCDERIIYIKNKVNLGGSESRNIGINKSSGKYITFLDDDDVYLPQKIEKQINYMKKNSYQMTFTKMLIYNSDNKLLDVRDYPKLPIGNNEELLKYHLMHHMTGTPTFMYEAQILKELGGFDDIKMGQEFCLMLKTIQNNIKIGYIDECYIKVYKHNEDAISKGTNKIKGEKNLYMLKRKFFPILNKKEIRYIDFRHLVVLSVAFYRNHNLLKSFLFLCKAFIKSPVIFISEIINFSKKTFINKNDK